MQFLTTIPDIVADSVRTAMGPDLGRAALEAIAIEGYRKGDLSLFEVRQMLGFDNRWDTENWLGDRGVNWNYGIKELNEDRETLAKLFPLQSMK